MASTVALLFLSLIPTRTIPYFIIKAGLLTVVINIMFFVFFISYPAHNIMKIHSYTHMIFHYIYIIILMTSRSHSDFDDELLSMTRLDMRSKQKAVKCLSRFFSFFLFLHFLFLEEANGRLSNRFYSGWLEK